MPAPEMLLVVNAMEASRPNPLPPKRPERDEAGTQTASSPDSSSGQPSSRDRSCSASIVRSADPSLSGGISGHLQGAP